MNEVPDIEAENSLEDSSYNTNKQHWIQILRYFLIAILIIVCGVVGKIISEKISFKKTVTSSSALHISITPAITSGEKTITLDKAQFILEPNSLDHTKNHRGYADFLTCLPPSDSMRYLSNDTGLRQLDNIGRYDMRIASSPGTFRVVFHYTPNSNSSIDENNLIIYYCDDGRDPVGHQYSTPLKTIHNATEGTYTAESNLLGLYNLFGKLKCSNDIHEPYNDHYIASGGDNIKFGMPTSGIFDLPKDVDWYGLSVIKGEVIKVSISKAAGVNVIVNLRPQAIETVASNESNNSSTIEWTSPYDTFLQLEVKPAVNSKVGCDATYSLLITKQ